MHFINRQKELAAIEESWARRGAQFLALYGRRRIGKTALLLAFARDKPYIYWVASRLSSAALFSSFSRTVHQFTSPDSPVANFRPIWASDFRQRWATHTGGAREVPG